MSYQWFFSKTNIYSFITFWILFQNFDELEDIIADKSLTNIYGLQMLNESRVPKGKNENCSCLNKECLFHVFKRRIVIIFLEKIHRLTKMRTWFVTKWGLFFNTVSFVAHKLLPSVKKVKVVNSRYDIWNLQPMNFQPFILVNSSLLFNDFLKSIFPLKKKGLHCRRYIFETLKLTLFLGLTLL